jgi:hypothetical protein
VKWYDPVTAAAAERVMDEWDGFARATEFFDIALNLF